MQTNPGAVWDRDDNFISYRTSKYKLHYYETPTLLKFVLITDAKADNKRVVLHQIYVSLYVEFVVKNPLRELEGPVGVTTFALALDQFVRTLGDFN
jgi:trafficking protein particle complex subunit 1